jgi:hypothetical protein
MTEGKANDAGALDALVTTNKGVLITERLRELADLSYESEEFQFWLKSVLTHEEVDIQIKNFFENVSRHQCLKDTLRANLGMFQSLFYWTAQMIFTDGAAMEVLVHNIKERDVEKEKNQEDRRKRILKNPLASPEEYRLGTYIESIESQAREAVLHLLRKGYQPMESGFCELEDGSQYFGINKKPWINVKDLEQSLVPKGPSQELELIRNNLSIVSVEETDDRVTIKLIPKNPKMILTQWTPVLNAVVSLLPDLSGLGPKDELSDNANQGVSFRRAQDKMRAGENTWICPGLAFVRGRAVEMTYADFIKLS